MIKLCTLSNKTKNKANEQFKDHSNAVKDIKTACNYFRTLAAALSVA